MCIMTIFLLSNFCILLLLIDEPSNEYWKELAEARREALDNTLKENEQVRTTHYVISESSTFDCHVCIEGVGLVGEISSFAG